MTEIDPAGRCAHEAGAKLDQGKVRYSLIPPGPLKLLAALYTYGTQKYSEGGWKEVPAGEKRYLDALMRHLEAYRGGEWLDSETGLPHMIAVAWNAFAIVYLELSRSGEGI